MNEQGLYPPSVFDQIFRFDKSIRFVVTIGQDGNALFVAKRPGVESLEPAEESKSVFLRSALGRGLTDTSREYHGRTNAIIVLRERVTLILFPAPGKTFLISAEPGFKLQKVGRLGKKLDMLTLNI